VEETGKFLLGVLQHTDAQALVFLSACAVIEIFLNRDVRGIAERLEYEQHLVNQ
jgi:hypothetical protein